MKLFRFAEAITAIAIFSMIFCSCKKNTISLLNINDDDTAQTIDTNLYKLTGGNVQETGQLFLSLNSNKSTTGNLLVLDQNGHIIKEKALTSRADDFQKWTINGQTRYSYLLAEGDYATGGPGTEEGYDVICDSNFNEISQAKFLSPGNIDNPGNDRLDVHDFILLGDNHYMAISDQLENPTNIPDSLHPSSKVTVTACLIQEVNNGQVVFQWDGTKYPELYSSSVENNNFSDSTDVMDYMHMNSICIDPNDNNIICSFRNLNEIIKINRVTGDIMWRLGGKYSDFPLTPDQDFLRQHYARFTDDNQTLMFVDNGEATLRPYSRILEFQLDETQKVVKNFTAFNIPDAFIQYAGSVKKENGNYFIGGGAGNYALEVNYTTNQVYLRINQSYPSYRALKY